MEIPIYCGIFVVELLALHYIEQGQLAMQIELFLQQESNIWK